MNASRHTPVPPSYPETESDIHSRPTTPAPPPSFGDTEEVDQAWRSDSLDIEIDLDDPEVDIEVLFDSIQIAEAMLEDRVPPTQRSRIAQVTDRCNWALVDCSDDPDTEEMRRADHLLDEMKGGR